MEKSNGKKKIATSVFISGRGSNLKSIINFSKKKKSHIEIKLVVSNNKNAKGLVFSEKNKISSLVVNYKNKNKAEKKILKNLMKKKIKLICLAGFMKILSKQFIKKFHYKIINIHPSLLPKYKGLNTHKKVIENKEKFTGCTVHFVNSKLDDGRIIIQKKMRVLKNDNEKRLAKRLLKIENKLYPLAIEKVFKSNL